MRLDRLGEDRAMTSREVATSRVNSDPPGAWIIGQQGDRWWPSEWAEKAQLPDVESQAEFGYFSKGIGL